MNHPSDVELSATDLILVNPAAGGGRAGRCLPRLKDFARQRRWPAEFCIMQSTKTLAETARAAAVTRRRILVVGGDGTFQALVNALIDCPATTMGVIPAGGGNDLAASLGLPLDPVAAAEMLLPGEVTLLDLVRVRTAEGQERLYCGGGGTGLDAEAARYAGEVYRNLPGRSRYLMAALRALLGFRSTAVRITVLESERQTFEADVLLVGVLNTPSYGGGLYLAPQAEIDDGQLDLVILESMSFPRVLTLLPRLAATGRLKTQRVRRLPVQRVRIETDQPRGFHGDGEWLGSTPVELSIVPRAVRVARAASFNRSNYRL